MTGWVIIGATELEKSVADCQKILILEKVLFCWGQDILRKNDASKQ